MNTTIDSRNRLRDALRLSVEHPLLTEQGRNDVYILDKNGVILATGYDRVVYGDHGPYIEFNIDQINTIVFVHLNVKSDNAWYNEWYTADRKVMFYEQKNDVSMLPNPPKGKYSVKNNRKEGYADYKEGKFYVDPDQIQVKLKKDSVIQVTNETKPKKKSFFALLKESITKSNAGCGPGCGCK